MATTALVSFLCPDRVGLIAAVTGRLFDLGINLGDTTFAVLGEAAEFTSVCTLPGTINLDEVQNEMESIDELDGAEITVVHFDLPSIHGDAGQITHRISINGGDRPGLMARLCELFQSSGANIVRLNSEHVPDGGEGQYMIRIAASIPQDVCNTLIATVANTAGEMGLHFSVNEA